jgi:hypothetical protein
MKEIPLRKTLAPERAPAPAGGSPEAGAGVATRAGGVRPATSGSTEVSAIRADVSGD